MVKSERAADYPWATREECLAPWEKASGRQSYATQSLWKEKELEAAKDSGVLVAVVSQEKTSNQYAADAGFLCSPCSSSSQLEERLYQSVPHQAHLRQAHHR